MRLLVIYLVLMVPVCALLLAWAASARRSRSRIDPRTAAELRELEASRDLIDRLLDAAVDHRDVDPVFAPLVIDEIRTHQRSLRRRSDDELG